MNCQHATCGQSRICPRNLHRQPCVTPWECRPTLYVANTKDGGESVHLEQENRHRLGGGNVFLTELTEVRSKEGIILAALVWASVALVACVLGYVVTL